jgi:hypothetical protein
MLKKSAAIKVCSLLAAAFVIWTPVAGADDPNDPNGTGQQDDQNKKTKDPNASIAQDILDQANKASNGQGQQPANGPDRNQRIGGGWMTVNGVLTCVPNGATFRNNERVESVLPPNGDPRC